MIDHVEILNKLLKRYGGREGLAVILGVTAEAVYFWEYRKKIPDSYHAKILAIDDTIKEEELIENLNSIKNLANALSK
jgi:hypothetical protein